MESLARNWRSAEVPAELAALLGYAEKLTRRPQEMGETDVQRLRDAGWSDEAVLHVCEVVAYFNFVNRTADGLGVSLEEGWDRPIVPMEDPEEG